MSRETVGFGVALGLGVLGLVIVFVPNIDTQFDLTDVSLTGLGLLALLAGAATASAWLRTDTRQTRPLGRERTQPTSTPGDEFDDRVAAVRPAELVPLRYDRDPYRGAVVDDLRETAIDVLERCEGCSRAEAEDRLRAGTWSDDAVAATFFTPAGRTDSGASTWIADTVGEQTTFERRVGRVVDELAAITETEGTH